MRKIFQIGAFCFELCCTDEIRIPPNFLLFECADGIPQYEYRIKTGKELPVPEGKQIAKRPDIAIFQSKDLESRLVGIKGDPDYYACYEEVDHNHARVTIRTDKLKGLHIDPVFSSLLALERRMLQRDSLIFHCAYLQYQGKAILFSAPSGVGKSTQAGLWETYQNGETINGDRALLQKENHIWVANGWPVCGTSRICKNISMPIHAIVMLSQSKENRVQQMKGLKAVQELYTQTTVNSWDIRAVNQSFDLLENLTGKVPIYHLACDISEEAVNCLKNALYKNNL